MSRKSILRLAAIAGLGLSAPVYGDLAVNFTGSPPSGGPGDSQPRTLMPTDSAGVIPRSGWVNVNGKSDGGTAVTLTDTTGASSPITLNFSGDGTWSAGRVPASPTPNAILMNGYVDDFDNHTSTYKFNNVPAGDHTVIVYSTPDGLDGRTEDFMINGNPATDTWESATAATDFSKVGFKEASGANAHDQPAVQGNFLLWNHVTPASDGTITINGHSDTFRNFVNGIELLDGDFAVPEPGSLGLLSLAGLGLLQRRRRR